MISEENLRASLSSNSLRSLRVPLQQNSLSPLSKKTSEHEERRPYPSLGESDLDFAFPTTRFYGSKRRHLPWLRRELGALPGQTALDAFGGTGAVSHLLSSLGWRTTYNDIFEFNTISARAIFSQSAIHFDEKNLLRLLKSVVPNHGFISETFDKLYFHAEENRWLDGFMTRISSRQSEEKDLLLYCLFQACLKKRPFNLFHRANLNLRNSVVPVQFGNRTTWNKPFSEHIMQTYRELRSVQMKRSTPVEVMAGTCAKNVAGEYDLVYLDPPYFKQSKRNTDTYLQRYHFLEGLARFEDWPDLIDDNSPQKVIDSPYRDEWTNKRGLLEQIQNMIKIHPGSTFAVSYVSGEEPTEVELFELFADNFDRVRLSRRSFNRVLSNKESFEILLIGQ